MERINLVEAPITRRHSTSTLGTGARNSQCLIFLHFDNKSLGEPRAVRLKAQGPAVLFDDLTADGKAQAGPALTAPRFVPAYKGLKDPFGKVLLDGFAVVGDRDPNDTGFFLNQDEHLSSFCVVLAGIFEEVTDRTAELDDIQHHRNRVLRDFDSERDAGVFELQIGIRNQRSNRRADIKLFERERVRIGLQFRVMKESVDHLVGLPRLFVNNINNFLAPAILHRTVLQGFRKAEDRRDRCLQIMGDVGVKDVLLLHLPLRFLPDLSPDDNEKKKRKDEVDERPDRQIGRDHGEQYGKIRDGIRMKNLIVQAVQHRRQCGDPKRAQDEVLDDLFSELIHSFRACIPVPGWS